MKAALLLALATAVGAVDRELLFSSPETTLPTTGQKVTGVYHDKTANFHGKG